MASELSKAARVTEIVELLRPRLENKAQEVIHGCKQAAAVPTDRYR